MTNWPKWGMVIVEMVPGSFPLEELEAAMVPELEGTKEQRPFRTLYTGHCPEDKAP